MDFCPSRSTPFDDDSEYDYLEAIASEFKKKIPELDELELLDRLGFENGNIVFRVSCQREDGHDMSPKEFVQHAMEVLWTPRP